MEFSYYGCGKIDHKVINSENGVHKMMLEGYVDKKITELDEKISKLMAEGLAHVRRDMARYLKSLEKLIWESKKSKKIKTNDKNYLEGKTGDLISIIDELPQKLKKKAGRKPKIANP